MKKLIILILSGALSCATYSQERTDKTTQTPTIKTKAMYCASLKDGKMVLMTDGKVVAADIVLPDGTKITPDATVIKKDGTKNALRNGECVDKNGNSRKEL